MANYNFTLTPVDTDSISFCKEDMSFFSKEEREKLLNELNSLMPKKIKWDDDGYYSSVLVLKAKNYVLQDEDGEITIKGSSIKDNKRELALREMIKCVINSLLIHGDEREIEDIYQKYIKEACDVKDINRWCKKVTITEKVLNPQRTNEQKVLDAIEGEHVQMGDKIYVYFDCEEKLKLVKYWEQDEHMRKLVEKVYKTLDIFKNILDMEKYVKYHNKKSYDKLEELCNT